VESNRSAQRQLQHEGGSTRSKDSLTDNVTNRKSTLLEIHTPNRETDHSESPELREQQTTRSFSCKGEAARKEAASPFSEEGDRTRASEVAEETATVDAEADITESAERNNASATTEDRAELRTADNRHSDETGGSENDGSGTRSAADRSRRNPFEL